MTETYRQKNAPRCDLITLRYDNASCDGRVFVEIFFTVTQHNETPLKFLFSIMDGHSVNSKIKITDDQKKMICELGHTYSSTKIKPKSKGVAVKLIISLIEKTRKLGLRLNNRYYSPIQVNDIYPGPQQ